MEPRRTAAQVHHPSFHRSVAAQRHRQVPLGLGHTFSDNYEPPDRSLKNYFHPRRAFLDTNNALPVYAPASGTLHSIVPEQHQLSSGERRGHQISLRPDGYPAFEIRLFHVNLAPGLAAGAHVTAGDQLGYADLREAFNVDWAVGAAWNAPSLQGEAGEKLGPTGYRLLSPYEVMSDAAFAALAPFGLTDRNALVVPLDYRNAHPGTFGGSDISNFDPLDYVVLARPPTFTVLPPSQAAPVGEAVTFTAEATDPTGAALTYRWSHNGTLHWHGAGAALPLVFVQPLHSGLYTVAVTGEIAAASEPLIFGVSTTDKVIGSARVVDSDIYVAANGNTFDQTLLEGPAAAVTADFSLNQITRLSFIDLDHDIVQVELSGPGTLSLVVENASAPARPLHYNQAVDYVRGHAGIVIVGATEQTNVSVFSVGRATAVNPTLFPAGIVYDGFADIAFIAILSSNGKFGGVRAANTTFFAQKGLTGIYAPGVEIVGPLYIGDLTAADAASPVIVVGSASDARITGGDLLQLNSRPVKISGLTRLTFTAGSDSHGTLLPAAANRAVLQHNGVDVTDQIVVSPTP